MVCRGACADDIADCSLLCDLLVPLRTSDVNKEDLTPELSLYNSCDKPKY